VRSPFKRKRTAFGGLLVLVLSILLALVKGWQ
jgi:hypothetical protein